MLKVYSPEQVAAILYDASITSSKYGERVLGASSNPNRLTLTNAKVMANHLGDEAFAGSATIVALVADGRENCRKGRRKTDTCYRCHKKGHLASECLAVKPVAKEPEESAAVAVTYPIDDSGFAWSLSATDVSGFSGD